MHFPLSWRWPRWYTLRIPLGAAMRFSVPRGGASLVRLASSTRDCMEAHGWSLPAVAPPVDCLLPVVALGLGHHWRVLSTLRGPWLGLASSTRACSPTMLPCTTGALTALFAPARSVLEAALASLRFAPMVPLCHG
ncbi:hypothetical protein V6N12_057403 [Hibiscus sabdariffa]|uniref:Uncharacterized protein n=1 Tax=Hibiscus sabdariffa TaxID=183260 RepID=A0ABR2DC29_9ROSI